MSEEKQVEFLFSTEEIDSEGRQSKDGISDMPKYFAAKMEDITEWFRKYEVQSIELWIQGAIETNGVLKLLVSVKGEGGMKVTLKPRDKDI